MIDLDLPPPPVTASWRPSRRLRRDLRPVLAVVLVAAAAMTLGAAGVPAPEMVKVLSVDARRMVESLLTPSVLYTTETGGAPGARSFVRAQPLVPGAARWSSTVQQTEEALVLTLHASAGVLVVGVESGSPSTFLDAATGATLWRVKEGGTVLAADDSVVVATSGIDDGPGRIRVADLRTGRTIWSRTVRHVTTVDMDHAGHVVTVDYSGRATTYRFADGRVLATADLGGGRVLWDSSYDENVAVAAVVGDQLYARGKSNGVAFLRAYRIDSLAKRWGRADTVNGSPADCAGELCIAADDGLTVFDPRNGSSMWSDPRWSTVMTADPRWLRTAGPSWSSATAAGAGLIWVADVDALRAALVDAATGRIVRSLGSGVVRGGLLLRSDSAAENRTWITDLATGHVLAAVDDLLPQACTTAGDYLGCPVASGDSYVVWRL